MGSGGGGRDKESKKDTMMMRVAWIKVEVRKEENDKNFFYFEKEKIRGPTTVEVRTATVPR